MINTYKSKSEIIHLVQAGYICNLDMGKVEPTDKGTRNDITCKNCKVRLN